MRRDPRVRLKKWLWWAAFFVALLALQTVYKARVPITPGITLWLAQGTIRVETDPAVKSIADWKGHPWEVRYQRRAGGVVVEVGAYVILCVAGALAVAAFFVRPRRTPPTLCWSCWYDLRALPPNTRKCPECGAEQQDQPV